MDARIDVAREDLRARISEADEARAALSAAKTPSARSIAREILESRSLAVDQAATHVAMLLSTARARSILPTFRHMAADLAYAAFVEQRAAALRAVPQGLTMMTCGLDFELLNELVPHSARSTGLQVDRLIKKLKTDPMAEL